MRSQYEVDIALMRATIRWIKGQCGRREIRKSMLRVGWSEPYVSNYLDMVQRAMRQIKNSPRARKESA